MVMVFGNYKNNYDIATKKTMGFDTKATQSCWYLVSPFAILCIIVLLNYFLLFSSFLMSTLRYSAVSYFERGMNLQHSEWLIGKVLISDWPQVIISLLELKILSVKQLYSTRKSCDKTRQSNHNQKYLCPKETNHLNL